MFKNCLYLEPGCGIAYLNAATSSAFVSGHISKPQFSNQSLGPGQTFIFIYRIYTLTCLHLHIGGAGQVGQISLGNVHPGSDGHQYMAPCMVKTALIGKLKNLWHKYCEYCNVSATCMHHRITFHHT